MNAFSWPKGTVRAILAISAVGVALLIAAYVVITNGEDGLVLAAAGFLWGAANLALGYYLGKQDS